MNLLGIALVVAVIAIIIRMVRGPAARSRDDDGGGAYVPVGDGGRDGESGHGDAGGFDGGDGGDAADGGDSGAGGDGGGGDGGGGGD